MSKRNTLLLALVVVSLLALAQLPGTAQASPPQAGDRFLIIMPHTQQQCLAALDDLQAASPQLLAKTDWGCMAGDHTGYLITTAANAEAALKLVPANERAQAKVIKLNKFTAEQIASFHKKM